MKKDWTIKKLGEVCDFIGDGDWIESKDQSTKGIRLIQTGNIGNGIYLDKAHHAHFISEETFSRLRCTEIFPGDCLISRLPDPVGRACIIPKAAEKMITAVDCTIIRFNKQIVPEYFVLYAQSNKYFIDIDSESTGATRKRISRKNLEKISVPIPPLGEQKRIVAVLDKKFAQIETLKTAAEKNLQNTKQLFQAELEKLFINDSWKKKSLGDICKITSGGTPSRNNKSYWESGNIPWVKTTELQNNELNTTEEFITQKGLEESSAKIVPKDTILLAMYGQGKTRGMTAYLNIEATTNQACACILPPEDKNIYPKYIWKFLIGNYDNIRNLAVGCNQPNLNSAMVKSIIIPLPPLEEQKRIVVHLDSLSEKVHQLEEIYTKQLADCDELKQSLLQKAFEGEL